MHAWISHLFSYLQGKATGNKMALWLRSKLQSDLFSLGSFVQKNPGKVLFFGIVLLFCFSLGLKSARFEWRVEKLWVEGKSDGERSGKCNENGQLGNFHSKSGSPIAVCLQLRERRLFGQEGRGGRRGGCGGPLFHH